MDRRGRTNEGVKSYTPPPHGRTDRGVKCRPTPIFAKFRVGFGGACGVVFLCVTLFLPTFDAFFDPPHSAAP